MLFNSLTFLVFFALVLLLHNLPFAWRTKKLNLLVVSYLFYAAWNPPFVLLIMLSTVVDWYVAIGVYRAQSALSRRLWLAATLAVNLGVLGFFKYGTFLMVNFARLMNTFGWDYHPARMNILLPVGISFYTFVTLSYTLDIYWKRMKPWDSFLDFAMFVTFFPHLVAGPVLRAADFLPQCKEPKRPSASEFFWGLSLFVVGLFEKNISDFFLAPAADAVFDAGKVPGTFEAWIGALAFSGQIFCDFAGYSTCAIGVAKCLGFWLPQNFNFPYASLGFADFWHRWHISLSTWLRDYLYIPLGGNRLGRVRTYANLLITMLLGGLWHGASWTFVVWGGLHGGYLAVERFLKTRIPRHWLWDHRLYQLFLSLLTFLLVTLTWVFFRAQSVRSSLAVIGSMVGFHSPRPTSLLEGAVKQEVLLITAILLGVHWFLKHAGFEKLVSRTPWWLRSLALFSMIVFIWLTPTKDRAFIYFQF